MVLRFWRRARLAPGVTVNLSKTGASLSLGPRGAKYTIGPRGSRMTAGIPGSGLFYTVKGSGGATNRSAARNRAPRSAPRDPLSLNFFERLLTPAAERALIEGLRQLDTGARAAALAFFERGAPDLPDAAWMAGMLRLQDGDLDTAQHHLSRALAQTQQLGTVLARYEVDARISLPIAAGIEAHVRPRERGTRLALAEIARHSGNRKTAMDHLERLLELDPTDPVVILSLVELALETRKDQAMMERVVALTAGLGNDTPVHSAILLYRGRALAALGLRDAAIEVLTLANRRRKDRPEALLRQIRYDRAVLYEAAGRRAQARREFERLYAEAPGFADLRARLGLTP